MPRRIHRGHELVLHVALTVSVITPAYNAAAFLDRTIASVRAQTFENWEMLVADDGSTDATVEVARRAADGDERVRVETYPHSGRPAVGRNRALSKARGRVIAFLDADDIWLPEKLERQLAILDVDSEAWAFGNVTVQDDRAGATPDFIFYAPDWRPPDPFLPALLAGGGSVPCATLLVTRSLLARISESGEVGAAFDESDALRGVEDWDLAIRLASRQEPAYLAAPLALYLRHYAGITHDGERMYRNAVALLEKCRRQGLPPGLIARAKAIQRSRLGVARLRTGGEGWRQELLAACLLPPRSLRDVYLGFLGLLPRPLATSLYILGAAAASERASQ
jgi:glycosyltransferase involved in cell wall biosynthesis